MLAWIVVIAFTVLLVASGIGAACLALDAPTESTRE
jgi:hypothetical protein